ncbi:MAG: response regulator [Deltaproteobacteria bacterium]|nr:MAG: response regulator [Deltaproteobacteria bacterium]
MTEPPAIAPSDCTVLVADDQARARAQVAALLAERGYRVLLAHDGAQAVQMAKREAPDVAIVDVVMPHTDGLDVVRRLRADDRVPYIPVLLLSSSDAPPDRVAGLRAGADDFLGKPYHDEELVARVEALARVGRLVRAARRPPGGGDRDPVTGLRTAAYLTERVRAEFERAGRHAEPLSLMLLDIDAGGAGAAADRALAAAADALRGEARAMDVVARADGAAFAVVLPNTHFAGALATAERLWRTLAAAGWPPWIGAACYPGAATRTAQQLVSAARSALARARADGPARVCLVQHEAYIFQPE